MNAPDSAPDTCFHCGLPVPAHAGYHVTIEGHAQPMCCPGCQAVAQSIVDYGLVDYYRHRTEKARTAQGLVPEALQELELYDRPALQENFVRIPAEHEREASLILEGIVCAACVWLNERHINQLDGIVEFRVNYATHRAQVRWDEHKLNLSDILKAITEIGYLAHPYDPGRQQQIHQKERRTALRRIGLAGLGMVQVMMLSVALYAGAYSGMEDWLTTFLRWISLIIATPVVLYSARPFFTAAWRDLRHRQLGMDVPVALAIGAAFIASVWATVSQTGEVYFDSVTMFTFFLLSGRYLEMRARHQAGEVAEAMVKLLPASAHRWQDGQWQAVSVESLKQGDRVLVKPGETVPADGEIIEGSSSLDESLLSGESVPVDKGPGDVVIGGSVNRHNPLQLRVQQVGQDTVLSAIVRLLDRAQSEKPRMAQLADRVAGWFVAAIIVVAMAVAAYWWQHAPEDAFWITLSVLVVTCPCALSLATPAAMVAATGRLTQMGVLVTRGHALETLARIKRLVWDKTGTLTEGRLQVAQVRCVAEYSQDHVLALAAALEQSSEHPVAQAIRAAMPANLALPTVSAVENRPGMGIAGLIDGQQVSLSRWQASDQLQPPKDWQAMTVVTVRRGEQEIGLIGLADQLREGARETVSGFRQTGIASAILSGDNPTAVDAFAEQLSIEERFANHMPQQKLQQLQAWQRGGETVAMIGDGVNDAPVLSAADVSLAMGSGTQLARASADMVLFTERLPVLLQAHHMARRTLTIIRQNFAWAIGYNLLALPLAAAGYIAPWMAAIGMSASSLIVVINALRLKQ